VKLPPFISDLSLPPLEYHQRLRGWSRETREASPIIWDDHSASWLVFRYDDVARVQSDYQTFSSEGTVGARMPGTAGQENRQQQDGRSIIFAPVPRHQSFGHGIHFCLGAPLARLEVRIVFEKVAQKFEILRTVPGAQLKQVQSLPVEFQAAHL
jgi:cytochrome P450